MHRIIVPRERQLDSLAAKDGKRKSESHRLVDWVAPSAESARVQGKGGV